MIHKSVFLKELVKDLPITKGSVLVDLTLGAAGHSKEILLSLKSGTLIAFDLSKESIKEFSTYLEELGFVKESKNEYILQLKKDDLVIYLINKNFTFLVEVLKELSIKKVDGVIADLGWSSDQLTQIEGLSYESDIDALLDMRFDESLGVKASDLLNGLGKKELAIMFERYADVRGAFNTKLVESIVKFRNVIPVSKVRDLKLIIDRTFNFSAANKFNKNQVYKTYSRVFQALRIAVNSELINLNQVLEDSFNNLNMDGIISVITFHSGEDKVVIAFLEKHSEFLNLITKNSEEYFIRPSVEEIKENVRSRSAKLYKFKRIK